MSHPVTFLMAVYNGQAYLEQALASLFSQSMPSFDCLVIDDGSSDDSGQILSAWAAKEPRLSLQTNPHNIGLTRSLNRGLEVIKTPWVARLDADDIAHPERLERQLAFLDSHPKVGLLGSSCERIDAMGSVIEPLIPPLDDLAIRWRSLCYNPFYHASMIFRRSEPDGTPVRYDANLRYSQDYALWCDLLEVYQGANLAEPLLQWRSHGESITQQQQGSQQSLALGVVQQQLTKLWPERAWREAEAETMRRMMLYPPHLVGNGMFAQACALLTLWQRFKQQHGGAALGPLEADLVQRLLNALPADQWPPAWQHGLLKQLIFLAPGGLPGYGMRRVWQRLRAEKG
uniref:Putative GT2: distantly related to UDP-GalNAc: globotriose b-1,3-N-acetylgalactosaminyltransferase UDP-Gal:globotetraose b-1,3-galactosyltransferase n=1 Tax=Magnetococcus massalia (strain MO-1) TaxID=451514 RepID=A0A1S7LQJ1_MAGMO|nr:Putative GT2 : distantly related to UDP-GalNAc: globotriose b-1,3-N-acetylgalactosaminyltransferase UDP-Gal:globotetraose b-1,3-galactosyltransferase [Candidatus Magnetococcus massalia]